MDYKHGHAKRGMTTPIYQIWLNMKDRCINPKSQAYPNYGSRGIKVCERWLKFENFLSDMGERPKGLTLERINNNDNYEPDNCKWATQKEQCNNTRVNRILTYNSISLNLTQWSLKLQISRDTLHWRLSNNWPLERMFKVPDKKLDKHAILKKYCAYLYRQKWCKLGGRTKRCYQRNCSFWYSIALGEK